jgi:6-phosphogluconolactonase (cycloisomerase 2 family)
MKNTTRAAAVAGFALAATAVAAGPAAASTNHHRSGGVFVQTNSPDGNKVVAYDGKLHETGSYPTGGNGGALTGAVVDPLASQGALALDRAHGLLYAVNAGSNSLTVFGVHGDRLSRRQVVGTGGVFPVSVAVHGDVVYVLNARDGGSIQGYRRVGDRLLPIPSWHRALGLDATATPEFTHTPGQVAFSPDGRQLLVTTKANTNEVDVFAIDGFGGPAAHPVRNVEAGTVPFALTFDRYDHVVLAEAAPNAVATFTLGHDGKLTALSSSATGQAATCWIVGANGTFYSSNAGSGTVTALRAKADGTLESLGNFPTDPGTIDGASSADGRTLYVQTGATDVIDAYQVAGDGTLTRTGSASVPDGAASEGIAAF